MEPEESMPMGVSSASIPSGPPAPAARPLETIGKFETPEIKNLAEFDRPHEISLSPEFLASDISYEPRVAMIAICVIVVVVVFLRVYARTVMMKYFGLDDLLMLLGTIAMVGTVIITFRIVHYGGGRPIFTLTPYQISHLFEHAFYVELLYCLTLWLIRASGLSFYARITDRVSRLRFVLMASWVLITCTFILQSLLVLLVCIPIRKQWTPSVPGKCYNRKYQFFTTAVTTVICDSVILMIPMAIISRLRATTRKKIVLGIVLCFGLFAVIISIVRIKIMDDILRRGNHDPVRHFAHIGAWSTGELAAAIIALSMPALKPLFGRLLIDESTAQSNKLSGGSGSGSGSDGLASKSSHTTASTGVVELVMQKLRRPTRPGVSSTASNAGAITTVASHGSEEQLWEEASKVEMGNGRAIGVNTTIKVKRDDDR